MKTACLIHALAKPEAMARFSDSDWDITIRQARASGLLAALFQLAHTNQILSLCPKRVQVQLTAAHHSTERHREVIRWEVEELHRSLQGIGVPIIVLKGAAYVMTDLVAAKGRLFGDLDIMVPRGALADVEKALGRAGWVQENRSAYDDRYYRKWMHEIPARKHIQRGSVLDVHHNILPLTARNQPQAKVLWDAARPVPGFDDLYVLSPEDMLLHSSSHLFLNGEFDRGLRDLNDFRSLGQQFCVADGFWEGVRKRAEQLDLAKPLAYSVRYANLLLDAHIPEATIHGIPQGLSAFMDGIFLRGLAPNHSTARDGLSGLALFSLYVRGHYLRMPFHLLIPHLLYKATLAKYHDQALQDKNQELLNQFRAFIAK